LVLASRVASRSQIIRANSQLFRSSTQMIVATPLKSVMTLEPFIGGACYVHNTDRRSSSVLRIDYDREHRRLDLPQQLLPGKALTRTSGTADVEAAAS